MLLAKSVELYERQGVLCTEEPLGLIFRRNCRMTKAEYRRNGTIIRTGYYDTPEQTQDALVAALAKKLPHRSASVASRCGIQGEYPSSPFVLMIRLI